MHVVDLTKDHELANLWERIDEHHVADSVYESMWIMRLPEHGGMLVRIIRTNNEIPESSSEHILTDVLTCIPGGVVGMREYKGDDDNMHKMIQLMGVIMPKIFPGGAMPPGVPPFLRK